MDMTHIVNELDRFMREVMEILNIVPRVMDAYKDLLDDYQNLRTDCQRGFHERDTILIDARNEIADLRYQMRIIRKLIDEEKTRRKSAESERDYYRSKMKQISNTINKSPKNHSNLTKSNTSTDKCGDKNNNAIDLQTTDSIMADLSYTRDEHDFDLSFYENRSRKVTTGIKKKTRRSLSVPELTSKDSTIGDTVSTVTISADRTRELDGTPGTNATDVPRIYTQNVNLDSIHDLDAPVDIKILSDIKTPTTPELNNQFENVNLLNFHSHNFQAKTILKGGTCRVCLRRLRFSTVGYKCRDCKTICHEFCKDNAPLPCQFNKNTPAKTPGKVGNGLISDYTPKFSPMVPSLVVHCIKEIESRGLNREGLYLIPGSDTQVKYLISKFLRGKGVPDLSQIQEIDDVCECLKDFFRSLKDPLATRCRWADYASAVEIVKVEKMKEMLYQIISELPQPNKETLAFLVLHLKKITESPGCKMTASLLANVFGPIIIGYSCDEPTNYYKETRIINKVMVELIELHKDYWAIISSMNEFVPPRKIRKRYFETP